MGRFVAAYTHIAQASWLAAAKGRPTEIDARSTRDPCGAQREISGKGEWDSEGNLQARGSFDQLGTVVHASGHKLGLGVLYG